MTERSSSTKRVCELIMKANDKDAEVETEQLR